MYFKRSLVGNSVNDFPGQVLLKLVSEYGGKMLGSVRLSYPLCVSSRLENIDAQIDPKGLRFPCYPSSMGRIVALYDTSHPFRNGDIWSSGVFLEEWIRAIPGGTVDREFQNQSPKAGA